MDYMDLLKATLLGILQGITEFLPVSSSGHLVAAQALLGLKSPGVILEVSLHFGTLLAILLVFWDDLLELIAHGWRGFVLLCRRKPAEISNRAPHFFTALAIVVGSVPAGLAGVFLKDYITPFFEGDLTACGSFLIVTGIMLIATRWALKGAVKTVGPGRGFLVGAAQALALLPGISRSGSTIAAGLYVGLERDTAARFAFLLAVPAMAGAVVLELAGASLNSANIAWLPVIWGTAVAAVVGWVSLKALLPIVKKGKLHYFAAYCIPVGGFLIGYSLLQ